MIFQIPHLRVMMTRRMTTMMRRKPMMKMMMLRNKIRVSGGVTDRCIGGTLRDLWG